MNEENLMLVEKAFEAQKNSYSPYSHFKVGAAVLTKSGKVFLGTNIENSSYGATICAERNAILGAVCAGERNIEKIALVGGTGNEYITPCGMCRQVMIEFNKDLIILLGKKVDGKIEYKEYCLNDFLPNSFGFEDLKK